jgi:hypothetical protein
MVSYNATLNHGNRYILSQDAIIFDVQKPRVIDAEMKAYLEKTALAIVGHTTDESGRTTPVYQCKFKFEAIAEPKATKEVAEDDAEPERKTVKKSGSLV